MPAIWDNIKGSIDQLEKRKAPPTDWAQAADKAESVTGQRQLMLILKPVNINSAEMSSLSRRLRSSAEVHHYGFEGNFNAMVFFTQQQEPEHVVRW